MIRMVGGNSCSVIFIGNDHPSTRKFKVDDSKDIKSGNILPLLTSIKKHFLVPLDELPHRIFVSLVPPILGERFRRVYIDFLGPSLALLVMAAILHYGHASKLPSAAANTTPTEVLLLYAVLMPAAAYILGWLCKTAVSLSEMYALLGYGLYGHVFTLAVSLFFFHEESNTFFFLSLIVFGGMSALRVALILLASIPAPAARLFMCSSVASVQLLFLVFLHFAYMHRTFVYAAAELRDAGV